MAPIDPLDSRLDGALDQQGTSPTGAAGLGAAPGIAETSSYVPPPNLGAGAVLAGRYKLTELIGEGGMGSVWVAQQSEPVKRKVAVKLIKLGMDSRQVIARFEAERQALAMMDHPNIAKVLDGGLHDGRPFFVMELVKGVPITQYCDARKLTPRERSELFVPVCQAIQHAHQKGIIHRDIKPSNVLVALYDDKPVPKVIDFGVAKATGAALTDQTIETGFGGVVGTPQYMSPEQATLNNLDIDTRSDVYSLGVLLYELLTGSPPFAKQELEKQGLLEMLRIVREVEPPRPSTKLSTADALPTLSANRSTEPKKLTGLLRNELDWIVMKALEKDRARRYETANGFAADVQRYLSGEAVQAHPPSAAYRLQKFVRRYRGQVIAASLVLCALLAGVIGTTLGLFEARRQADLARSETAAKETALGIAQQEKRNAVASAASEKTAKIVAENSANAEREAKKQAEARLAKLTKTVDILGSVFQDLNPNRAELEGKPLSAILGERLDRATEEIEGDAVGDPLAVARLQLTLARSHLSLGYPAKAAALCLKARPILVSELGSAHRDALRCGVLLANSYLRLEEAEQALAIAQEVAKLAGELSQNDTVAWDCLELLAECYSGARRYGESVPLYEEVLRRAKATPGITPYALASRMNNLAVGYKDAGRLSDAIPLFEEVWQQTREEFGDNDVDTALAGNNLAASYQRAGNPAKAIPLLEGALKTFETRLSEDHPTTLGTVFNLGICCNAVGQAERAIALYERAMTGQRIKLGPDHAETLNTLKYLAPAYWRAGRLDKSTPLFEELYAALKAKRGPDAVATLDAAANLGVNYRDAGRLPEAIQLLELVWAARVKHPSLRWIGVDLLVTYAKAGEAEKGRLLVPELVAASRAKHPPGSLKLSEDLQHFGIRLWELKEWAAAAEVHAAALQIYQEQQPDAWTTFSAQSILGGILLRQKKYAEAEPLLLKGYDGLKQRFKTIPPQGLFRVLEALDRLIELYQSLDKPDEVAKWRTERASYEKPELQ